ncbi:DNA replication factor C complex subunit Rfc1 [Elasticomyces elasticus]|nr:DNA replication factor C complex subunit Rfc1 [Elasticomyces elasticus]
MPTDIRSFFGGKPAPAPIAQEKKVDTTRTQKKLKSRRKVVDDSEDDEDTAGKSDSKRASPKKSTKRIPTPDGEVTTTTDYFATNGKNKPKRSSPQRPKTAGKPPYDPPNKTITVNINGKDSKASTANNTPNGRSSTRKRKPETCVGLSEDDEIFGKIADAADDVSKVESKKSGRSSINDLVEGNANEDHRSPDSHQKPVGRTKQRKRKDDDRPEADVGFDMEDEHPDSDFVVPDDDKTIVEEKSLKKSKSQAGRKRKSKGLEEDDGEVEVPKNKSKKLGATPKASPRKKARNEEVQGGAEVQVIFDSIPTVRLPSPPPETGENGEKKKFVFGGQHGNSGPPPAAGSKERPIGAENCLAGLSFVFTGMLQTLERTEGQNYVKQYGGKVMTAPSSKTSYVVLGSDAGPKKLETIRKFGLKTIDEDGLFELVRRLPANGGDSKAAAENEKKKQKEEDKMMEMAAEMEAQERRAGGLGSAGNRKSAPAAASGKAKENVPDTRLWTVKYAPQQLSQICGNKAQVEKLQRWLRNFPKNQRTGFKLAGADGSGVYRAVMIHGPPGIGKTTAAHLVAKLEGYDIVESNASDTRSKKLVETGLKGVLSTTSLLGYFAGDGQEVQANKKKLVLIMDEVDGMSAGDRGGVGALAAVCKRTQIPMILICNDRKLPKMKPFDFVTYDMPFRRPTTDMIRSRIMTIAFREGLKMPPNVINALIEGTGADIRQIVNMVSTAKLDEEALDFEGGRSMSKAWEKHVILKPWDIVSKILGGGMFAASSKATLNDKVELYFNDHEFSYLMLEENYLGTNPILSSGNYGAKEKNLKLLDLASKAADSISDGDMVDRMIHGSQQQWSLMPVHAVFSFVRPASFVAGSMAGHQTRFTTWLGNNSKQGKLTRLIKEIQGHMRLRTSGDRHEIRQQYVPILWQQLIKRLEQEGKESVPQVIELMDSYFLTRDDWDAIFELGVGPMSDETVKLDSQTKATFTRLYNQQSHPLPFMKASSIVDPRRAPPKTKPDLEEAIDESDEGETIDPTEAVKDDDDEDMDVTKDKYVAKPKKKKVAPAKAKGKGKRTADDVEDNDLEDEKPKKPKGKGTAATKAKGRNKTA